MIDPAFLPGDPGLGALLVIAVLLVGVPLFVVAALAVVSGYVRHDAERFLEELDEDALEGGDDEDGPD